MAEEPVKVISSGLTYEYNNGTGARMLLSHMRSSSGELSGRLAVKIKERPVHTANFTISSTAARNTLVKSLLERQPHIAWREIIEEFCVQVLDMHDQGSEVLSLNGTMVDEPFVPVLPPLLTVGHPTILFGEGGCGKSTLAAAVALSLTTGEAVIPWMNPTPMNVLILDWEDHPTVWGRRLRELKVGCGIDPSTVEILYQHQNRPLKHCAEFLSVYCRQNKIEVVIVDSMGMAMGAGSEHTPSETGAIEVFAVLSRLGVASLIIDHVVGNDLGSEKAIFRPYGSVYKYNLARSVFELKRERDPMNGRTEAVLVHTKSNYGQKQSPQGLAFVYGPGSISIEKADNLTAEEMQATRSLADRMAELLANKALPIKEIAQAIDAKEVSVRVTISRNPNRFTRLPTGNIGLAAVGVTSTNV